MPFEVIVSVIVHQGRVIHDTSQLNEDTKYSCRMYDRGCNQKVKSSKNKYISINSSQIMRILPNGKKYVLTWDKKYPEN